MLSKVTELLTGRAERCPLPWEVWLHHLSLNFYTSSPVNIRELCNVTLSVCKAGTQTTRQYGGQSVVGECGVREGTAVSMWQCEWPRIRPGEHAGLSTLCPFSLQCEAKRRKSHLLSDTKRSPSQRSVSSTGSEDSGCLWSLRPGFFTLLQFWSHLLAVALRSWKTDKGPEWLDPREEQAHLLPRQPLARPGILGHVGKERIPTRPHLGQPERLTTQAPACLATSDGSLGGLVVTAGRAVHQH